MTPTELTEKNGFVAVVPARGGSKGIPRKNLCPIGGVPLVSLAIRAAVSCESVDSVVLSTDDEEIASIGRNEGAIVLERPRELASDEASTLSVLQELLPSLITLSPALRGVILLEPTSPFRPAGLIEKCVGSFFEYACARSVATVVTLDRNPRYILAGEGNSADFLFDDSSLAFTRRQDFTHLKRVNGCVYIYSPASILSGALLTRPLTIVEMPATYSLNIDSPLDLDVARFIHSQFDKHSNPFTHLFSEKSRRRQS